MPTRRILSSDDGRAIELANAFEGIEVMERPASLAGDRARNVEVLRDVVLRLDTVPDYTVLLQPTCPLRRPADIDSAVRHCLETGAESCITVGRFPKSSYWLFRDDDRRLRPLLPRDGQTDMREPGQSVFVPNGAVFVIRTDVLLAGGDFYSGRPAYHEMPAERSIDIDNAFDLHMADAAFSWLGEQPE